MDTIYTQQVLGYRYTSMGVYTYYKNVWRSGKINYGTVFYEYITCSYHNMPHSDEKPVVSVPAVCEPVIVERD